MIIFAAQKNRLVFLVVNLVLVSMWRACRETSSLFLLVDE